MSRVATPRLRAALWLTAVAVIASFASARPEPVAVAAPFALLALIGVQQRRGAALDIDVGIDRPRLREGDVIAARVDIASAAASDRVDVRLALPRGLGFEPGQRDVPVAIAADGSRTIERTIVSGRWGSYTLGTARIRRYAPLRLVADERSVPIEMPLRVYPPLQKLRALVRPLETQAAVGDHVARARGDGIELAELRPFVAGDEPRRVNWRATARTGELVVNELHPERSTDVVIVLDASADEGSGVRTPLDQSVRAAAALAEGYLARRDRVGLLIVGGTFRWLRPARGAVQQHRIFDSLLETRVLAVQEGHGRAIHIPARAIPSQALVLVVSPLVDDVVVRALLELRGRGFDLAVVEISPLSYLEPRGEREQLALRYLRLERDLLRTQIRSRGIAVVEWDDATPLDATVRALEEYRRRARVVHA